MVQIIIWKLLEGSGKFAFVEGLRCFLGGAAGGPPLSAISLTSPAFTLLLCLYLPFQPYPVPFHLF
jgi:hypothetical protein